MGKQSARRAGAVTTSTFRRHPFERYLFARRRPRFRNTPSRRWFPTALCFLSASVLLAAVVAMPLAGSRPAAADVEAPSRAAAEAALLRTESSLPRAASLDVPAVQQNPELPTGCESVALTNALLSQGFDLEKTEIADTWLPTSDGDFVTAFMGDPHASDGHSCMAPAIVLTAESYLAAQGSSLSVVDMTGSSLGTVLGEVAAGNPVVAWCTIDLEEPGDAYQIAREEDRTYRLFANSHCVVVSGYDLDAGTVLTSDSLAGQTSYDLETFATRYYQLGAQAVVVK